MKIEEITKWVGYLEHQSPSLLGVYTANPGKGGYTIFAEIIRQRGGPNLQGVPWCTTFVHALVNRADLLGRAHPGSKVLLRRMKRRGFFRDNSYRPIPGDLIFCGDFKQRRHVGIVVACDRSTVISIDGNTVDRSGTFNEDEGGAVAMRQRKIDDPIIYGYAAIGRLILE